MRYIQPAPQELLADGSLNSGGYLCFYENEDFGTPKVTFYDKYETQPNTTRVRLDETGRNPNIFGTGAYSVRCYSAENGQAEGILQWSRNDVILDSTTGQFSTYNPIKTYLVDEIVRGDDGKYYISNVGDNTGNDPLLSPSYWTQIIFIEYYNALKSYSINDIVVSSGYLYRSTEDNNVTAPPSAKWTNLTFNSSVPNGLTLGNTDQAGNTVLDWYEEGTFTPVTVGFSTPGVGTYGPRRGVYTRIGNVVTVIVSTAWTAHTGTGGLGIIGLPFASASPYKLPGSMYYSNLTVTAGVQVTAFILASSISFYGCNPAGGLPVPVAMDPSVDEIEVVITYTV